MMQFDEHILLEARLSVEGRKRLIADFGKTEKVLVGKNNQGEKVQLTIRAASLVESTYRADGTIYMTTFTKDGYARNKFFADIYWDKSKVNALWKDPSPEVHCHVRYYDAYKPTHRHKNHIVRTVAEDMVVTLQTATKEQLIPAYNIQEPHATTVLYSFENKLWRKCRVRQDIYASASTDDALYELKKSCMSNDIFQYGKWASETKAFAMRKVQKQLSNFLVADGELYFRAYEPVYKVTREGKLYIDYSEDTAFSAADREKAQALADERLDFSWDYYKSWNEKILIQPLEQPVAAEPAEETNSADTKDMPMAADYPGLPNICPLCYGELWYTDSTPDYLYWQCTRCGATGKEGKDWVNGDAIFDGYHYDVTPAPKVNYECSFTVHKDLSTCADSMLFDSGTQIATLEFTKDGEKVVMDLEVRGEVKVDFDGISYRRASGFPPELTLAIEKHPNTWDHALENDDHAIEVIDGNWFEFMYDYHPKDGKQYSDGIMCEEELNELTGDALQEVMIGLCKQIINNNMENGNGQ